MDERNWHALNIRAETVLFASWFGSGCSAFNDFEVLWTELATYSVDIIGVIIAGDLNIRHTRWLKFSNGNATSGAALNAICDNHGFQQYVKESTRNQYLLDLFLSGIPACKCRLLEKIANHRAVQVELPTIIPETHEIKRSGWILKLAKWDHLASAFKQLDWSMIERSTDQDALNYFLKILWLMLLKYILFRQFATTKESQLWLNTRYRAAIFGKRSKKVTPFYVKACSRCDAVFAEEY